MHATICIDNEMPTALRYTGIHYKDTQDLTLKELTLFIERDLYTYLKNSEILEPSFSVSFVQHHGISQIRVSITIFYQKSIQALRPHIDSILWAYNQQIFLLNGGKLKGLPPRFQFHVNIIGRDEDELNITSSVESEGL